MSEVVISGTASMSTTIGRLPDEGVCVCVCVSVCVCVCVCVCV